MKTKLENLTMKAKLQRIKERLIAAMNETDDDEVSEELDHAILHIESAIDRLVQIQEEQWEEELPEL